MADSQTPTQSQQDHNASTNWVDRKRYAWLLGLAAPLLPLIAGGLVMATDMNIFWWFGPFFIYLVIPLMDILVGSDTANPPEATIQALEDDKYYRWCTYLFIPVLYISLIFSCYAWAYMDLSLLSALGLVITTGSASGIAIANAHELGHKRESLEKRLSVIALAPSFYGHFFVEHNRGHHFNVATPEDPASSRLGENFFQFLPRVVIGSAISAWRLESERLRRGKKPLFSHHNELLRAWSLSLLLLIAVTVFFGWAVLPFFILQGIYGASLLEVVNYLEHYGLLREKRADGRYVRCQPQHSWNSNDVISNVFLYHLQRHSDHHANPLRRYQALRHFDVSPQLPFGYGTLIPIAFIPPLWSWLMDKRVVEHYNGDVTKANIHPPARERIMKRWGGGNDFGGSMPPTSA